MKCNDNDNARSSASIESKRVNDSAVIATVTMIISGAPQQDMVT